jgi:hypothetical protein
VGVALGVVASIGIGISDYLGRYCTRRTNATTTVLTALLAGVAAALVWAAVVPGDAVTADLVLGAASGLIVGFALMLLYAAMAALHYPAPGSSKGLGSV